MFSVPQSCPWLPTASRLCFTYVPGAVLESFGGLDVLYIECRVVGQCRMFGLRGVYVQGPPAVKFFRQDDYPAEF